MREFFKGWKRKAGVCIAAFVLFFVMLTWRHNDVLPSDYVMAQMSPIDVEKLVRSVTPIGTSEVEVKEALNQRFKRRWVVCDHAEFSNLAFHVKPSEGDYYFRSDFAVAGIWLPDVVTVHFLFDRADMLKDVMVEKWAETL